MVLRENFDSITVLLKVGLGMLLTLYISRSLDCDQRDNSSHFQEDPWGVRHSRKSFVHNPSPLDSNQLPADVSFARCYTRQNWAESGETR
jgi:hypothetical protein